LIGGEFNNKILSNVSLSIDTLAEMEDLK
jgi:hypothetical protein